ncbi:hypothetical protein BsWGS_25186 [Bradybaena similaris]
MTHTSTEVTNKQWRTVEGIVPENRRESWRSQKPDKCRRAMTELDLKPHRIQTLTKTDHRVDDDKRSVKKSGVRRLFDRLRHVFQRKRQSRYVTSLEEIVVESVKSVESTDTAYTTCPLVDVESNLEGTIHDTDPDGGVETTDTDTIDTPRTDPDNVSRAKVPPIISNSDFDISYWREPTTHTDTTRTDPDNLRRASTDNYNEYKHFVRFIPQRTEPDLIPHKTHTLTETDHGDHKCLVKKLGVRRLFDRLRHVFQRKRQPRRVTSREEIVVESKSTTDTCGKGDQHLASNVEGRVGEVHLKTGEMSSPRSSAPSPPKVPSHLGIRWTWSETEPQNRDKPCEPQLPQDSRRKMIKPHFTVHTTITPTGRSIRVDRDDNLDTRSEIRVLWTKVPVVTNFLRATASDFDIAYSSIPPPVDVECNLGQTIHDTDPGWGDSTDLKEKKETHPPTDLEACGN